MAASFGVVLRRLGFRKQTSARRSPMLQKTQPYTSDVDTDNAYRKTRLTIMNIDEDDSSLFIDTYSQMGFKLNNGFRVIGPCAVFPKSVLHWNVRGHEDVHEDSLCLFYMTEPKIDLLILGVGEKENVSKLKPGIVQFLKSKKITVEVLPTDHACSTFNFLNSEKRFVAAALIPPHVITSNEMEINYLQDGDPAEISDLLNSRAGEEKEDGLTEKALGVHGRLGLANLSTSVGDSLKKFQLRLGTRGPNDKDGPDENGRGPKY